VTLEFVHDLPEWEGRGIADLWKYDGDYVVISTIGNFDGLSPAEDAIVGLAGFLGGYATSGEETMAFPANEQGEVTSWGEIAVANGENSRQAVIDQLSARDAEWVDAD